MAEERPPYVARPEDLAALASHWQAAREGERRFVRLVAPFGGGRRALAAELLRDARAGGGDVVLWRIATSDQENGVQWLMRAYGALIAYVASDVLLRGKVEMVLNSQLPSETKRVQGWFQQFVQSLKEAKPDPETGQMQLRVSQDNPLIGLVEIVRAISRKIPVLLEVQAPYVAHTMVVSQFLEALLDESKGGRLLALVFDEPDGPVRESTHPAPLLDLFERRRDDLHVLEIAPWGEAEVRAFLASKGLDRAAGNAAELARIARGRPGFVAELVEILEERGQLDGDLAGVSFATLVPMQVDEDELEAPEAPPAEGERRHVGADDAGQIAYLAALLGQAFPSALVAEMGGYEASSVDDLIDAMGDLFEEVQFSEQMNTWIYRFQRGSWREGVLERNETEEGHDLARRVALFMERFLAPRGVGFVVRTCRIYGEHGAASRASAMRALGLTQDDANAWGLVYELMRYFDETPWPATARRTVFMTLLDHMVGGGPLQATDRIHGEVTEWAKQAGDEDLQAWLLFNGSKLDLRRQDLYRARERAQDALQRFEALGNPQRSAEVHAQLAAIALADGKGDEALAAADASLAAAMVEQEDGRKIVNPGIASQAEMVRGVVARRKNELETAIEHFRRANEIAGSSGLGALAIDAGLSMGEALLSGGKVDDASNVLQRVLVATQQLGAAPRERAAAELLAQAEGARRNFQGALQLAQRCLQISQGMNLRQFLPIDLYNVGFFLLTQNKGKEALPLFEQAETALGDQAGHPLHRDLAYHAGLAALQAQQLDKARSWLQRSLEPLRQARDARKLVTALDQLAGLEHRAGNVTGAKQLVQQALDVATQAEMKDERKTLQKRLETL